MLRQFRHLSASVNSMCGALAPLSRTLRPREIDQNLLEARATTAKKWFRLSHSTGRATQQPQKRLVDQRGGLQDVRPRSRDMLISRQEVYSGRRQSASNVRVAADSKA